MSTLVATCQCGTQMTPAANDARVCEHCDTSSPCPWRCSPCKVLSLAAGVGPQTGA